LRLTPFFVRVRAQKPAAGLRQPPSTDSCPLRRRQSVRVVRGRCVTSGDGKILHHQPSIINLSFPDSCPLRRRQSVRAVRGRCVTFGDSSVWKTPRAERGCSGKKSRCITTRGM